MIHAITSTTHFKIYFDEATKEEKKKFNSIIKDHFTVHDKSLDRDYRVRNGLMSKYVSLYDNDNSIMLTGLLPFMKAYCKREELDFKVHEKRKYLKPNYNMIKDINRDKVTLGQFKFRDYQVESLRALVRFPQGGIIKLPPGSGKTLISAGVCSLYDKANILMVFDALELMYQTYEYLTKKCKFSPSEVGLIGDGKDDNDKRISLLSMMSYQNMFHIFPRIHVVIADECHTTGRTDVSERILYSCQNATTRIGLSATPDLIENDYEQMKLYGNLGPIVYKKKISEQIAAGILADINVNIIKHKSGKGIKQVNDWQDVYKRIKISEELIDEYIEKGYMIEKRHDGLFAKIWQAPGNESLLYVMNEHRNKLIAKLAKKLDRVLVLYNRIEHGKLLHKLLPKALLIYGDTDNKERNEAKNFIEKNKKSIVLSSKIWDIGKDIPAIENLIIASAGVSGLRTVQKSLRVSRNNESTSKFSGTVWDFWSMDNYLGNRQSEKRYNVYSKTMELPVTILEENEI